MSKPLWKTGDDYGSPVRLVAQDCADEARENGSFLCIRGECFVRAEAGGWQAVGGGTWRFGYGGSPGTRRPYRPDRHPFQTIGVYENVGWGEFYDEDNPDPRTPEEVHYSWVKIGAGLQEACPDLAEEEALRALRMPGLALEAIVACPARLAPPLGVIEGGRILALRLVDPRGWAPDREA
ncbi:MAG: hypothetical protein SGJ21_09705 [Alphaproteobacteria bacterium]|nr:hypothetical protein [Alphaproteobacteria bacterium]